MLKITFQCLSNFPGIALIFNNLSDSFKLPAGLSQPGPSYPAPSGSESLHQPSGKYWVSFR